MRRKSWLQLLFWMVLFWGLSNILSTYTSFPKLNDYAVLSLAIGIFIFHNRPLLRAGFPPAFETSVASLFALVLVFHLGWEVLAPKLEAEEVAAQPCAPSSLALKCYTFSKDNCTAVWDHYAQSCQDEVKAAVLRARSTALTGPMVKKCIHKKIDRSFRTNRRTPVDETCQQLFSSLDAPSID